MFITIKLKHPYDKKLIEMSKRSKEFTQIFLDYGSEDKTFNKINKGYIQKGEGEDTHASISTCTYVKGYCI